MRYDNQAQQSADGHLLTCLIYTARSRNRWTLPPPPST